VIEQNQFLFIAVNGNWSQFSKWSEWNQCNVTCGGGSKDRIRNRTCTNPEPMYGGLQCKGHHVEMEHDNCNENYCPGKD